MAITGLTTPSRVESVAAGTSREVILVGLGLILLTLLSYWPAMGNGFIWDDGSYVLHNATLHDWAGFVRMWSDIHALPQFYPMTHTTFWVEKHLWGYEPAGYHLTNVLLHAGSAIVLWRLLLRLKVPGAMLAAILFAVHPLHVESVAWITERKNCLAVFLYLLAFTVYWRMLGEVSESQEPRRLQAGPYALTLVLFVCALLSKTITSTLPAAIALVLWWKQGKLRARDLLPLLPMLMLGAAFGAITSYLERTHVGASGSEWNFTLLDRVLIAGRAVWFYVGKVILPVDLTFIYHRWKIDPGIWWQWVFPIGVLMMVAGLFALRGRIGRGPLTAVLFFIGTCTPALGFFDIYPMRYSFVADHFAYPASIGLIVLFAAGLAMLLQSRRAVLVGAMVALTGVQAGLTFHQTRVYRDLPTLWADVLKKDPTSWMAATNYASWHVAQAEGQLPELQRQHIDEAARLMDIALRGKPGDLGVRSLQAKLLSCQGNNEQALSIARDIVGQYQAKRIRPDERTFVGQMALLLGNDLLDKGDFRGAMDAYGLSLQTHAFVLIPLHAIAWAYTEHGQYREAQQFLEEAVKLYPNSYQTWVQLGDLHLRKGELEQAFSAYGTALQYQPDDPDTACGLAGAAWVLGQKDKAVQMLQAVVENAPESAAGHAALSLVYAAQGQEELMHKEAGIAQALRRGAMEEFRKRGLFQTIRPVQGLTTRP